MTAQDIKFYLYDHKIPQLFECLMTALMYNRPDDPTTFLSKCLERLQGNTHERITWDLLLKNNNKHSLPPIGSSSSSPNHTPAPLPPIAQRFDDFISSVQIDSVQLEAGCRVIFGITTPGSSKRKLFHRSLTSLQAIYPRALANWHVVSLSHIIYQFLNAAAIFKDDVRVKHLRQLVASGDNVPDVFVVYLVAKYMQSLYSSLSNGGIIIEGFPRTDDQRALWEAHMTPSLPDAVVLIDCEENTVRNELADRAAAVAAARAATGIIANQRRDGDWPEQIEDQPNAAERRIELFKQHSLPVCKHYDDLGRLRLIDGELFDDLCAQNLEGHLKELMGIANVPPENSAALPRPVSGTRFASLAPGAQGHPIVQILDKIETAREDPEVHKHAPEALTPKTSQMASIPATFKTKAVSEQLAEQALRHANVVFVLGGPGSGKGTQCERIVKRYGFAHLSTGDLLRDELKSGSERAASLKAIMESGALVSLDIVLQLLREAMLRQATTAKGFLVDGFPRELDQATRFENEVAPCKACIYFEVSDGVMTQRLLKRAETSGRVDDNEETIKKRLATFHSLTEPVVDHFRGKGKLILVNAETDIDTVFGRVRQPFDKLALQDAKVFFVLGGPGSGKGTQCERIVSRYGYSHLSTGDLLRDELKSGTERAAALKATMESGALVSLDVVLELLKDAMVKRSFSRGFLIDGFPRELEQAKRFENEVAECRGCVYFEVSDETMTKRLVKRGETSGRVDDNEETIKKRLATFHQVTEPVISYYRESGKLRDISAETDVDTVFEKVKQEFDPIALQSSPVVFVLGGPGSGKGTQCERIVSTFGYTHLSTGDLLRDEVSSGSARGSQLKAIMESGALVSLDIVLQLLKDAMLRHAGTAKGFLIDGFPRELDQATRFEKEVAPCRMCVSFEVSDETMKRRLLKRAETSGRVDDNEATIVKRLATFHSLTEPVIEHYSMRGRQVRISAEGGVDEVFSEVRPLFEYLGGLHLLRASQVIFVLGGPGSGKGTQCERMVEHWGFGHLSTGDLLRDVVKSGSPMGEQVNAIMQSGGLVSLDIVLALLRDAMLQSIMAKGCTRFLIDGFPREIDQAKRFENEVCVGKACIYFEVADETMKARLLKRAETSGRVDDNEKAIEMRLRAFHALTEPVAGYFDALHKLAKIHAEGSVDEVFAQVEATMHTFL